LGIDDWTMSKYRRPEQRLVLVNEGPLYGFCKQWWSLQLAKKPFRVRQGVRDPYSVAA
jgi:hypothetical protein